MVEEKITSPQNSKVKKIRALMKKKNRWSESKFIVEGIRGVDQLLKDISRVDTVVYSDKLLESAQGKDLLGRISDCGVELINVSEEIFESLSDTQAPQYVMAVVNFSFEKLENVMKKDGENYLILLDRIQDPGNLGTIIRTAEALGFDGILLSEGTVDIYNPKVIRSTMGAILQIPIIYYEDYRQAIEDLKSNEIKIVSSSLDTDNMVYDVDLSRNVAIVIGNEGSGISDDIIASSDELIKIPMIGQAESLNAGIASGIIMYEVLRQRNNL